MAAKSRKLAPAKAGGGMLALMNLASGECARRNSTRRAAIQKGLALLRFPGFPFDFAQGGEPVEPRFSSRSAGFVRNDS
jgi:hypothetical protein